MSTLLVHGALIISCIAWAREAWEWVARRPNVAQIEAIRTKAFLWASVGFVWYFVDFRCIFRVIYCMDLLADGIE